MADHTQTVTNAVRFFGGGPSTKWGQAVFAYTMTWGTAKWGSGDTTSDTINSIPFTFMKVIDNSLAGATSLTVSVFAFRSITNTVSPSSDMTIMRLYDGTGLWNTVFTGATTNADSATSASWSDSASSTVSYTCGSVSSITWSSL